MAGKNVVQAIGPSYHLADIKAACQSAVNCYPQKLDTDSWMLANSPGEVLLASLPQPVRGSHVASNRWFVAAGSALYEVQADGTYANRGAISGSGYVGMDDNKTQLAVVTGGSLYIFDLATNSLTEVSSPGWRGSDEVQELDGYFVFVDPDSDQFYLSAIDNGTDLNALDFSSADSSPDDIVTHRVSHRQLWLFGAYSTEIWINSGDLSFPFVRYQSYTLDVGVVGKRAAIKAADTLFWIGQTEAGRGIVYRAAGNQPVRVSTQAVEEALRGSTDLSAAEMWAYQIEGHEFIGINAPGLATTWVYDAATEEWTERAEWYDGWQPLRSRLVTAYRGAHYAGDSSGALVRLDASVNTLAGRPLVRERTWPHLKQASMEPIVFTGLELSMQSGSGGVVTLEISNDGGSVFGPPLARSLGATGRRMQRVRWLGLGAATNRVFRLRVSDDVPFALYSAAVDT